MDSVSVNLTGRIRDKLSKGVSEKDMYLHGLLPIRLLQLCVVSIDADTKLPKSRERLASVP